MKLWRLALWLGLAFASCPTLATAETVTTGNLPTYWRQAVVRISSHGLSGTVIKTGPGSTLVLSSAHGWLENGDRTRKAITVDMPLADEDAHPKATGRPRLVAINANADLALVEILAGPFPCAIPVAKAGTLIGPSVRSAGYDEMRWLDGPLIKEATVERTDGRTIFTREIPWHGRSGGVLLDQSTGTLIGVVQGYEVNQGRKGPGMYVSAVQVRAFLAKAGYREYAETPGKIQPIQYGDPNSDWQTDPRGSGQYRGGLTPGQSAPLPPGVKIRVEESPCPNGQCPNGNCPSPFPRLR